MKDTDIAEIQEIVRRLEELTSEDDVDISIVATDPPAFSANREGYLSVGTQFLKGIYAPTDKEYRKLDHFNVDELSCHEDGEFIWDWQFVRPEGKHRYFSKPTSISKGLRELFWTIFLIWGGVSAVFALIVIVGFLAGRIGS